MAVGGKITLETFFATPTSGRKLCSSIPKPFVSLISLFYIGFTPFSLSQCDERAKCLCMFLPMEGAHKVLTLR